MGEAQNIFTYDYIFLLKIFWNHNYRLMEELNLKFKGVILE